MTSLFDAATDRYLHHPGGPAEFDRLRAGRNVWLCLRCRRSAEVDPRRPGNCPHCGTPFWSTFTDTNGPDMPPYMALYHTSDPSVSVADRDVIVRYEGGGWRWFVIRRIDGYPIAKGQPHYRPEDAEEDFLSLFEAFSNGTIKPDIDRSLKDMAGTTVAKVDPRTRQIAALRDMLDKSVGQLAAALPAYIKPEFMVRAVMTALQADSKLLDCEPRSVLQRVFQCSQLGLLPDGVLGEAYLVPFDNKKANVTICTLIIGYHGLEKLARGSGLITKIFARDVREGDEFEYEEGLQPRLRHVPAAASKRGKAVGYYAVACFRDRHTSPQFTYMSRDEVDEHRRKFALARGEGSAWNTSYDAMACKTCKRKLCNELPRAPQLQQLHETLAAEDRNVIDTTWSPVGEPLLENDHGKPQEEARASAPAKGKGQDAKQPEGVEATAMEQAAKDQQPGEAGPAAEATAANGSRKAKEKTNAARPTEADAFSHFETTLGRCGTMKAVGDLLAKLDGEYAWLSPGTQDRIREKADVIKGFIRASAEVVQ
jgi:recombination protein RecT